MKVGRVGAGAAVLRAGSTLALAIGLLVTQHRQTGRGLSIADLSTLDTEGHRRLRGQGQGQTDRRWSSSSTSSQHLRRRLRQGDILQVLLIAILVRLLASLGGDGRRTGVFDFVERVSTCCSASSIA